MAFVGRYHWRRLFRFRLRLGEVNYRTKQRKPIDQLKDRWYAEHREEILSRRTWRNADPVWQAKKRDYLRRYQLETKYGISLEEYLALLEKQNGLCAACNQPEKARRPLAVDHDHNTGRIRGLLCTHCNNLAGHIEVGCAEAVLEYLRKCQI